VRPRHPAGALLPLRHRNRPDRLPGPRTPQVERAMSQRAASSLGVVSLLTWVCLFPAGTLAPAAMAQDVLIIRPLANNESEVTAAQIRFEVEISAFSPVTAVKINGQAQPIRQSTWVTLGVPMRLKPGPNRIIVDATTEFGTVSREFVINLKYEEKAPAEKAVPEEGGVGFQLISMLGAQNSSNPLHTPTGTPATSGTRSFLILIPILDWNLDPDSTLQFQGILSRDRYGKEELAAAEVAFTQAAASWIETFGNGGTWKVGAGYNYIDQTYDDLFGGKVHLEEDSLVFTELRWPIAESYLAVGGLEALNRNLIQDPPEPDLVEDATAITLKVGLESETSPLRGKAYVQVTDNDAVGKYKDERILRFTGELSYLFETFILSGGYRLKRSELVEPDPVLGETITSTLSTYVLTGNYLLSETWIINAELLQEQQTSNLDALEYDNTGLSLAIINLF
jgi:hypothetical protein